MRTFFVCARSQAIYVCPSRTSSAKTAVAPRQATLKQAVLSEKPKSTLFYTHARARARAHTRSPDLNVLPRLKVYFCLLVSRSRRVAACNISPASFAY